MQKDNQWKPLNNLIAHSSTIYIKVMNPVPRCEKPIASIKEVCHLLRKDDRDFPLVDFNEASKQWNVLPGTLSNDPETKDQCIVWLQATHTVSTVVRFFRQLGWEITFTHWVGYD